MIKKNSKDLKNSSLNLSLLNGETEGGGDTAEADEDDRLGVEAGVDKIPRKKLTNLIILDKGAGIAKFKRFSRLKTLGRSGGATYEATCQVEEEMQEEEAQPECQGEPADNYPSYKNPGSTYLSKSNGKKSSKGTGKRDGSPKVRRKFSALLGMIGKKKNVKDYDDLKKEEVESSTSCIPFGGSGISLSTSGDEITCPKMVSAELPVFTTESSQSGRKECLYHCDNGEGSLKESRTGSEKKERGKAQNEANAKRAEGANSEECRKYDEWKEVKGLAASEADHIHRIHRPVRVERNNMPCLENIKQLLHLSDEEMKDLVQISSFQIDLDINTIYSNLLKESSESSISTYNINNNKNIFDVRQFRGHSNEKITTYKETSSLNWVTYVCNISIQESFYFCYNIYEEPSSSIYCSAASNGETSLWENCSGINLQNQGNNKREEKEEKRKSVQLDNTGGGLNAHIQKEIKKENYLMTNEYIDSSFDEIYYIQRINADNDSLFVFARIYEIYIFSKKWNRNGSGGKGSANIEGETLSDESSPCSTNVSVYVLVVLKNNLLKYIIRKKILNQISRRVEKWKKHIIIKAELIKNDSVPLCIRMIERNDHIVDYVVKNVAYFFDNYLRDFLHLLVVHVNDFFGLGENRTLENYFERSSKKMYHFVEKKKVRLRNMYNDIVKKNEDKKKKKKVKQGIQANQKKYTFFTYLFKGKKEHKMVDSPPKDEYSFWISIFEPAFYYITSNTVAHNYIIYMNHIYYRRLLFLYLFVFVVYLVVSPCPVGAL
ncbi:conserved Plasmodium protein, unknown function [Plasmodium knowlesi strain H]|uniref:Uncharacterized protein n=3 Tax=Plasmodium knowlesi TaxID=5850 RepID=A0A5K1UMX6_PLAKH|nr:conserved Plasmodium protein, unknown function [Plasmodium knowlesi strain H]OTN66020.1 Uncharacterized protein PKNOH_S100047600 [Plasmodium knowlesi]CAA9987838.1 conserved Plasmodium protein, unknown function [Plasmodium knowlesi strain H]SBO22343.1 conserved Plasmodium protein, unknown function [Plasmodium knowlesi strain H]SBO28771.1 conserved Plasmodium protein, unknown function [Plasmodium knowlesi strain H]VVS77312.1 conserved Plasmodium protein, unknown function [Plasmodium knowlesi |eukprot:XP_002258836.1 hypothetical protein, conserved in Plasmodium species [Plasmodium knowlesi strain H]